MTNPLSVVVFIHHGSRAGKLNARTNRRPFFIFRFGGLIAGGYSFLPLLLMSLITPILPACDQCWVGRARNMGNCDLAA